MAFQEVIVRTVSGLGYDCVEIERLSAGLLRITIDFPWQQGVLEKRVTVEDCERVTRQLQYVLEVENVAYSRLEVSSPGIDRILRHADDFLRFQGCEVDVVLKEAVGAAAQGTGVAVNRKKFRGILSQGEGESWQVAWSDLPKPTPGQRVSKKRIEPPMQVLGFVLNELREARLAPIVNFKGRAANVIKDDNGKEE